ncbi:MAG: rRNA maturation RNase YbeY [Acidobacteria bacterium]|nr:MAG: rRNA maturation RNase YbeY [Acidobacteriota bacterium]REK01216.1 MAG: rRNA maturation RNase YbeY [Acidobacteriota bacterium]REK14172.1 MAG: rRNA maturation RNase YbeY [Acidobacteriota bacterium]REK44887.1 MAG: rRNA maturation RNase YbeY [Acidobacteriota bacterium]
MPDILNRQRKVRVKTAGLRSFSKTAADTVSETEGRDFTVVLVSDRRMRELNLTFRGKDRATDVLSFPYRDPEFSDTEFLGDIVISAETASRQASENGLTLETELRQLILHGILHLSGYDHENDDGEMDRTELEYRRILRIDE